MGLANATLVFDWASCSVVGVEGRRRETGETVVWKHVNT